MLIDKKIAELKRKREFLSIIIARLENLTVKPSTQDSILTFEQDIQNYTAKINYLEAEMRKGVSYV